MKTINKMYIWIILNYCAMILSGLQMMLRMSKTHRTINDNFVQYAIKISSGEMK